MCRNPEKPGTVETRRSKADAPQQLAPCATSATGLKGASDEARSCSGAGYRRLSPDGMTRHARVRCQHRGLPPGVLDLLYEYGDEVHDKRGAVILYFNKKARRRMARDLGWHYLRCLEPFLNAYLVEAGGWVITVGHRHARITRH